MVDVGAQTVALPEQLLATVTERAADHPGLGDEDGDEPAARVAFQREGGEPLLDAFADHGGDHRLRVRRGKRSSTIAASVELGIYTFAELTPTRRRADVSPQQRLRDLIEEIELADQVGLDVFGVGEHHRPDFAVSAPAVVLAAAAERTKRIRLTSAVSVLSSDDPVRVFQDFATLDLLSGGRAEIMAGRGSFIESFPLFGYDLDDYDELFAEKLELLLAAATAERRHLGRAAPRRRSTTSASTRGRVQDPLPVWVAVGGNPQSAIRAGALGLPLALAIIGGMPERFAPFAELHRRAAAEAGTTAAAALSINSHGFVAETSQQAPPTSPSRPSPR